MAVRVVIDRDEYGWFVHTHLEGGEVHARPQRTDSPAEFLHDLIHALMGIYEETMGESAVLQWLSRSTILDANKGQKVRQLEEEAVMAIQRLVDYRNERVDGHQSRRI